MLYREIIAKSLNNRYTKHINTLCGQSVELLNVRLVATVPYKQYVNYRTHTPAQPAVKLRSSAYCSIL